VYPTDFTVFLKIRHPDIDPAVLTEKFGLIPEHSWKAGEARREDDATTRRESYWVAEVPRTIALSEDHGREVPGHSRPSWRQSASAFT
jgi:hypothetical protein